MRSTSVRIAQKLYWKQLLGNSNNSINIIKAVGRAGIQRAMDLFGNDDVKNRIKMMNVQEYVKDAARLADRQTDRLLLQQMLHISDVDKHLRTHGTHMSPISVVHFMQHCGRLRIPLGHDHLRVLNSRLKRSSPESLTAKDISKLFRAVSHLRSDVTEVRLFLVTVQDLLSSLPDEQFTNKVFLNLLNGLQNISAEYNEVTDLLAFVSRKLVIAIRPSRLTHSTVSSSTPKRTQILFKADDVSSMLYGCHKLDSEVFEVRQLLTVLTRVVQSCPENFSSGEAAKCLYGLRSCTLTQTSDGREILELLSALHVVIKHSSMRWSQKELGMALLGLQGISSDFNEMRELLVQLLPRLERCSDTFRSATIGSMLYGLKSCSEQYPEVVDFLRCIRTKLRPHNSHPISSTDISIAMLGLQNMSEHNGVVAKNIKSLAALLERTPVSPEQCYDSSSMKSTRMAQQGGGGGGGSTTTTTTTASGTITSSAYAASGSGSCSKSASGYQPHSSRGLEDETGDCLMTSRAIANALYGVHGKTSESKEVRKWLKRVGDRIYHSGRFSVDELTMAVYGLHNMSSRWSRVQVILLELSRKIEANMTAVGIAKDRDIPNGVWRGRNIGNVMYGLKGMSSDHSEVLAFVRAFTSCVEASVGPMNAQEIANALFGLQGLSSKHREVQMLVDALCDVIDRSVEFVPMKMKIKEDARREKDPSTTDGIEDVEKSGSGCGVEHTTVQTHQPHISVEQALSSHDAKMSGAEGNYPSDIYHNNQTGETQLDEDSQPIDTVEIVRDVLWVPNATSQALATSLYGLKNLHSHHHKSISRILFLIRCALISQPLNAFQFTSREITMSLVGLQYMDNSDRHHMQIIKFLTNQMRSWKRGGGDHMHRQPQISPPQQPTASTTMHLSTNATYAAMTTNATSVASTPIPIGTGTRSDDFTFSASNITKCFYSLRQKEASPVIRSLLDVLYDDFRAVKDVNGENISKILQGFRSMRNDCVEVQQMLELVAFKIDHCEDEFTGSEIAQCFEGIRNMSTHDDSLLLLLHSLSFKINSLSETMSSRDIKTILKSCSYMKNNVKEVSLLLKEITSQVEKCEDTFSSVDIEICLIVLRKMGPLTQQVNALKVALLAKEDIIHNRKEQNSGRRVGGVINRGGRWIDDTEEAYDSDRE